MQMKNRTKIVLDLEFTAIPDKSVWETAHMQIIEIGAVKLNDKNEVLGEFQTYVFPIYGEVNPNVTKLTGITQKMLIGQPKFPEAMDQFIEWIGTDRPRFYTWSNSDQMIVNKEAALKQYELPEYFYDYWVDLQKIHRKMLGFQRSMKLVNALGSLEIYFEGTEHGAMADAWNTSLILKKLSDPEAVKQRRYSSKVTYNEEEGHGFSLGEIKIKKRK